MNFIAQTEKIYNHLCDDLSRNIFENRLLFSLTQNYKFINNVVSLSIPDLSNIKSSLSCIFKTYANNVVIYGAGFLGDQFIDLFDKSKIAAICDSSKEKQGTSFEGFKIISPESLSENYGDSPVLIAVLSEKDIAVITEKLLDLGFLKKQIYVLQEIFNNSNFSFKPHMQYFCADLILPLLSKEDIFIDAGCYNCATSFQFIEFCKNKYKKIIAFEPNTNQYNICLEKSKGVNNMTIYPYGLWNENAELCFDNSGSATCARISEDSSENLEIIKTVKLDDILNGEKATFIKMDIEGAELNALKGAEQTILKYRPKLAICVYHKPEDIWEIPKYILSLHDDYKLYIRHYSLANGETVLYAV